MYKSSLKTFLAQNPFSRPLTQGFFYREKMLAIHRTAPDQPFKEILEVGGGQSGLTALLYPQAKITNIDLNAEYSQASCNQTERVRFVAGDATALPFDNSSFDAVTMFDVIEHIPDDGKAITEALRVLKKDGFLLLSTPNENWQFPYYSFMQSICPTDKEIMADWGHVRRGYTLEELKKLIDLPCLDYATFTNSLTVISHDVAFSNLSPIVREMLCLALSPLTLIGYALHKPHSEGIETVSVWQKGAK